MRERPLGFGHTIRLDRGGHYPQPAKSVPFAVPETG